MRAFLTAIALLAACDPPAPDAEEPRPVWVGEHFTIDTTLETEQLCAGSVQSLDRFIEQAFTFLAAPLPGDFDVPVEVGDISICLPATACYRGAQQTIFLESLETEPRGSLGTLRHELIHAITWEVWGPSIPFFAEGIATALGGIGEVGVPTPVGAQLALPAEMLNYEAAGRFTRFLIDTRGLGAYQRMYRGAQTQSEDGIRALFLAVYGESFADLEAEYLASSLACIYPLHLCNADSAEPAADTWSRRFVVSCDDPGYTGVRDPSLELPPQMETFVPLQIQRAGRYRLRSSGIVRIWGCGACDSQQTTPPGYFGLDTDFELDLVAGLYTLHVSASSTLHAVQDVELQLLEPTP